MAILKDIIADYYPPSASSGVPLAGPITITFSCLMDEDELEEQFFVSGADTDQFVGPGLGEIQIYPENVSQGDDFLESPGYRGLVDGTFSFETLAGNKTKMSFTPTRPMAPLVSYTAHLVQADDANGTTYSGQIQFSWTTGSGSIEVLPDTASTSVLTSLHSSLTSNVPLEIVKTTPLNSAVEQDVELEQIEIEFNKEIDPDSVTNTNITIKAYSATDHPSASASANENIAAKLTTEGKKVIIEI